jgi:MFS family permease
VGGRGDDLGSSVAGIDSTVVAVALPAIGRNLHAGFQALQWTVTSYTLTLGRANPAGRLPQRPLGAAGVPGRAELFTLASVLCAAGRHPERSN